MGLSQTSCHISETPPWGSDLGHDPMIVPVSCDAAGHYRVNDSCSFQRQPQWDIGQRSRHQGRAREEKPAGRGWDSWDRLGQSGMFQAATTLMFEQLRWGCPNEAQKKTTDGHTVNI